MSDPMRAMDQTSTDDPAALWTSRLILYVRVMACLSMLKGMYHWSVILGIGVDPNFTFETAPMAWRAATVFFAVIDLVAAVGLWLAAAWGGVVWLTAAISMAAVEVLFPQIYGGHTWVVVAEFAAIAVYLGLAVMAGRERPE
ncbi:MAG TPA: DUF6163 family protein [Xanthobacteraceae bacterium]|jgi:hypothetical protein